MQKDINDFFNYIKNKQIAVCGIGISNLPLIKLFSQHGAHVIACDSKSESQLKNTIDKIGPYCCDFKFGKNYLNNLNVDIIFRTPGLNYFCRELIEARNRGIIVTSEMEVFFDLCPCKIIAITGSDGKTTTTTIISKMLKSERKNVHLGGNIGTPLLPIINNIHKSDIAVVELSSFQLMSMRTSPDIAIITNISPNHLDIHANMTEYINAKKNIFIHQNAFSKTVLNLDNNITNQFFNEVGGKSLFFTKYNKNNVINGAYLSNDIIYFAKQGLSEPVLNINEIRIPGMHNVENYMAAICAIFDDVSIETIRKVAQNFNGVEHRTEFVREINGIKYYNDAIATSPTRTMRGTLSLFDKKIILIAGGYDKNVPFDELGQLIADKVKVLILMGSTATKIKNSVITSKKFNPNDLKIVFVKNMEEAVLVAQKNAVFGDIISLSPACASFDMYDNFTQKGKHFKQLVCEI